MVLPRTIDSAPSQGLTPRHLEEKAKCKEHIDVFKIFFTLVETSLANDESRLEANRNVSVVFEPASK